MHCMYPNRECITVIVVVKHNNEGDSPSHMLGVKVIGENSIG